MIYFRDYSKEDQKVLSEICAQAEDAHINIYLRVCDSKNISPFSGLLYLQVRLNKGKPKPSVAPTIDGSRVAAARSSEYAGSDEAEFDSEDAKTPKWCRKTVWRTVASDRRPFTAKVRWDEFKPDPPHDYMWNKKPYHMLAKVAEAQALRMAFPEFIAGAGDEDASEGMTIDREEMKEIVEKVKEQKGDDNDLRNRLIRWQKAVSHFAAISLTEDQMLKELGLASKMDVADEHLETLIVLFNENKAIFESNKDEKKESKF